MKTRNIIMNDDGTYNIVWFGSAGLKSISDSQNYTDNEVTVYSITRDNFLCNEFPTAVCGITSVTIEDGVVTALTIQTTSKRLKKQQVTLKIDMEEIAGSQINYEFSITGGATLLSGVIYNSMEQDFTFTMNTESYITLTLELDNGSETAVINDLLLKYYGIPQSKISADNYVSNNEEMVAKLLIQRLALIKGELWYDLNYGLPLMDKIKDKAILDIKIMEIINNNPYVADIQSFESSVTNRVYTYSVNILTIYNKEINISSNYNI